MARARESEKMSARSDEGAPKGARRGCKAEGGREPRRKNWGTRTALTGMDAPERRMRDAGPLDGTDCAVCVLVAWRACRGWRCVGDAAAQRPRGGRGGEISASHPVNLSGHHRREFLRNHSQSRAITNVEM